MVFSSAARSPARLFALAVAVLLGAGAGSPRSVLAGQELALAPRMQEGESYALTLVTRTRTRARGGSGETPVVEEDVRVVYRAVVTVLEVDAPGRVLRERHAGVRVRYERPEGSGSLFAGDVDLEVQRREGGLRVVRACGALDPRVERVVTGLLAERFAGTPEPELLDPGRPVAVGQSWELELRRVRELLESRGVRALELEAPATASLRRITEAARPAAGAASAGGGLEVHYRIPVAWSELEHMPANARTARSEARMEGRILLSRAVPGAPLRPVTRIAHLELDLSGVVTAGGVTRPSPWSLHSVRRWEERMEPVLPAAPDPGGSD